MNCCQCQSIEREFNLEYAQSKVRQYHENGAKKETEILIKALTAESVDMCSLLDIGGGLGVIEIELLKAGASEAINLEASSAYIEVAKEEAARQGLSDRIAHIHGDFIDLAPGIDPADIVIMDKVICCYDDFESLVKLSAEKAKKLYGLIYPRDTWWVKLAVAFENLIYRLQKNPFRVYVHPVNRIDRIIKDNGMKILFCKKLIDWQIVVYER